MQCNGLFPVEIVKDEWRAVRDPFRKIEMQKTLGGPAAGGDSKKSGSGGASIEDKVTSWRYYDKMSFMKPFLYTNE